MIEEAKKAEMYQLSLCANRQRNKKNDHYNIPHKQKRTEILQLWSVPKYLENDMRLQSYEIIRKTWNEEERLWIYSV